MLHYFKQLSVVRGAGKFVPKPTHSNYVYKTVEQRDKVWLYLF